MARLTQTIRASSRSLRRSWLALWLQDRRRARAAAHAGPTVPNAPSNLSATDEGAFIALSWQDTSSDELGFRLYRRVDAGTYGFYQPLGTGATGFEDSDVIVTHLYRYYVVAYNAVGESAPSNEASILFGAG